MTYVHCTSQEFSMASITLYCKSGFRGRKVVLTDGILNLSLAGIDGRINSLLVNGGMWVISEAFRFQFMCRNTKYSVTYSLLWLFWCENHEVIDFSLYFSLCQLGVVWIQQLPWSSGPAPSQRDRWLAEVQRLGADWLSASVITGIKHHHILLSNSQ